jgi:hypothetical protein
MLFHPLRQKLLPLLSISCATALMFPVTVRAESTPTKVPLSYEETIKSIYQHMEKEREQVSPQQYQEGSDLYHELFDAPVIQIKFHGVFENGTQTVTKHSSTLYFSKGEIFIVPAPRDAKSPDSKESRRFFTTFSGNVYTWEDGHKKGEILKRTPDDTLNFLFYSIDPSGIMRSLYQSYHKTPQEFVSSERDGIKRLMLQTPKSGFAGVLVREKPFWFTGFAAAVEKPTSGTAIFKVDPPVPLEAIPEAVRQLPKDVQFSPSQQTLQNWMVYL